MEPLMVSLPLSRFLRSIFWPWPALKYIRADRWNRPGGQPGALWPAPRPNQISLVQRLGRRVQGRRFHGPSTNGKAQYSKQKEHLYWPRFSCWISSIFVFSLFPISFFYARIKKRRGTWSPSWRTISSLIRRPEASCSLSPYSMVCTYSRKNSHSASIEVHWFVACWLCLNSKS